MIAAACLDWKNATLEQRESCAVPQENAATFLLGTCAQPGVRGCVLLQTCNRFEVYVELAPNAALPVMQQHGLQWLEGPAAHSHLFEVACGLQSQILGEEQILTQVRTAVETARGHKTTTAALETLFRLAVTAGKAVRTQVKFRTVPTSAAHRAVVLAAEALQGLRGKTAVVIGNGEMGRLAAGLLVAEGCAVTITLRSYRHGQTVVPPGCKTVPYDERLAAINGCDLLVSATKSPHFTVTALMLAALQKPPRVVMDMALPRDIDPACAELADIRYFNMDALREGATDEQAPNLQKAQQIIAKHLADYDKWRNGRNGRLAVFGGTSEGRALCTHLAANGVPATAFVATEYGSAMLPGLAGIEVRTGRLAEADMEEALRGFGTVVDATHPYAIEVSCNLRAVAGRLGLQYLRLARPATQAQGEIVYVPDAAAAAAVLAKNSGNALLTTGSKELAVYTTVPGYAQRLFPRVLPDADVVRHCRALGFAPANLVCMQGPFSHEMNLALLRSTGAKWLVTKNTGAAGGLAQKLSAAKAAGARVILLARPKEPVQGQTLEAICLALTGCAPPQQACEAGRFPLFVSLEGKPCLVVGGGAVGLRRAAVLQRFGARVTLVAPACSSPPQGVHWRQRVFATGDTLGMALVVAATNSRAVNHAVAQECAANSIPVSVADCPAECSFYFPAVCQSTSLTAGVVSRGGKHALVAQSAAAIRGVLEELDV